MSEDRQTYYWPVAPFERSYPWTAENEAREAQTILPIESLALEAARGGCVNFDESLRALRQGDRLREREAIVKGLQRERDRYQEESSWKASALDGPVMGALIQSRLEALDRYIALVLRGGAPEDA